MISEPYGYLTESYYIAFALIFGCFYNLFCTFVKNKEVTCRDEWALIINAI